MSTTALKASKVQTSPFEGQKPGTSGLRKPVDTFRTPKYTENFVQSILNAIPETELNGSTLIVGGDGRYFMSEAIRIIIQIAAANKVGKLIIGENGILSTPAVSCLIRKNKVLGGIILTASHNPGGPEGDFGIKYNTSNGGPAPEKITSAIFDETTKITEFCLVENIDVDLSKVGCTKYDLDQRTFEVEIVDSVVDYVAFMKEIFNFPLLKSFLQSFKIVVNGMNGVTGPYLKAIVCDELGAPKESTINCVPQVDFGGKHPDPNMTYAADFVELMQNSDFKFGAAFDGDGDRNMLLGEHAFFINPSDSIAVIAANADSIPYFKSRGLKGVARSMPTSQALDRVAVGRGMECFEVPTGWKFFGNLMDVGKVALCGEESFGTGSDHIREKDGIWAFLAWLSILACTKKSVKDIIEQHWLTYGRNYYTRYDYENVSAESGKKLIQRLRDLVKNQTLIGKNFNGFVVKMMDDFQYTDTIDGSVSKEQGIRIMLEDGSRIVFRLSGTSSTDATIRMYIEKYEPKPNLSKQAQDVLQCLVDAGLVISNLKDITGKEKPTVTT
ncbi:phosphoglucomutase-1-like [Rhopilema esculentum]|uniref:phosphoglucomutase-1-like n=1 Tax=Rhopilema esculentum TaxID=499914 RepID=UPI0031DB852A|eukprot:gene4871-21198_t